MDVEDASSKRAFLDRKLDSEITNLEKLKASLTKSSKQTDSMLSVLQNFQERLQKLEDTILPVYTETKTFKRRQDNIDKTLSSIDKVIGYYGVVKETDEVINKDHVSKDLPEYMAAMEKLQEAIDYFQTNHPGSPEYSKVNTLYQKGKKSIEMEFKALLIQHSRQLLPVNIADMLGESDELQAELGVQHIGMTTEQYMPQSARDTLQEISQWLVLHLNTTDFIIEYARTRGSFLLKSLQGLIDHQKSSSGESTISASPSVMGFSRSKKSSAKNLLAKRLLKKTATKNADLTMKKEEEEAFVLETEGYLTCVSALLKLIEFETDLMHTIIPEKHQRKVFDIMLQSSLDLIVDEGLKLGVSAHEAAKRYSFKEVTVLLPVVKHLRQVKPQFDVKLEKCQPVNRSKFPSLITKLDNSGNSILGLFIERIRTDPEKASNLPVDGTVHEITRTTMFFMNTLKEYADIAGAMLLVEDPMYREQNVDHLTVKVADYMTKVLSALGMNLINKSKTYSESDPHLAAIFMLNNYNFILQKLRSQDLLNMVHRYDPKVGSFYQGQTDKQRSDYSRSFSQIVTILTEGERPTRTSELAKMSDKEKQAIKDKFSAFNKELEELCRTQKAYAIPDPDLRESIKQENRERIVPQYEIFRNKFLKSNFTKNVEKYIKYTSHDVADMLNRLFDSTS